MNTMIYEIQACENSYNLDAYLLLQGYSTLISSLVRILPKIKFSVDEYLHELIKKMDDDNAYIIINENFNQEVKYYYKNLRPIREQLELLIKKN